VGEATVDARREVEATREELGQTISELRERGTRARDRVRRLAPYVIAGVATAAGVVVAVVIIRKRRAAPRRRRDVLLDMLAKRVAERQAQAERKANPIWRRTAAKALEAGAAAGVATAMRNSVGQGRLRPRATALRARSRTRTGHADSWSTEPERAVTGEAVRAGAR
jgi:hypothetical protein